MKAPAPVLVLVVTMLSACVYGSPRTQALIRNEDDHAYVAWVDGVAYVLPHEGATDSPSRTMLLDLGGDWRGSIEVVDPETCEAVGEVAVTTAKTYALVRDGAVQSVEANADIVDIKGFTEPDTWTDERCSPA